MSAWTSAFLPSAETRAFIVVAMVALLMLCDVVVVFVCVGVSNDAEVVLGCYSKKCKALLLLLYLLSLMSDHIATSVLSTFM